MMVAMDANSVSAVSVDKERCFASQLTKMPSVSPTVCKTMNTTVEAEVFVASKSSVTPPLLRSPSLSTAVLSTSQDLFPPPSSSSAKPSATHTTLLNVPLIDIEEFVETTIVLKKDKKNELGISVVGGSDTYLETVCVSEVHQDGAAYKDGRLKCGDILLAVNDRSLRDLTSAEALRLLRDATSPVRLVVLRENPQLMFTTSEEPTKYITVELRKVAVTDRLGLSIMHAKYNGSGVFVTWVRPGSLAARHGRILQGDRILEVNGQNVRCISQKELAATIQNLDGAIVLLLGRVPTLTHSIQEWARMKVGSPGRIRTSTWSYTAKEKLQSQRPSLPATSGKDSHELLVPVPIPFPIPPAGASTSRFGGWTSSENSPRRSSGIIQSMRRTLGPEGAKLPLVVPLKIDEELLNSSIREKVPCPRIQVTNC